LRPVALSPGDVDLMSSVGVFVVRRSRRQLRLRAMPVRSTRSAASCGAGESRGRGRWETHEDAVTVKPGVEDIGDVDVWVRRQHQLGLVDTVHRIVQQRHVHLEPTHTVCTSSPHHPPCHAHHALRMAPHAPLTSHHAVPIQEPSVLLSATRETPYEGLGGRGEIRVYPTHKQKQDWILKCLQGGRAHPLTVCGVATLCCSPPALLATKKYLPATTRQRFIDLGAYLAGES
jgi:hypothetical protein